MLEQGWKSSHRQEPLAQKRQKMWTAVCAAENGTAPVEETHCRGKAPSYFEPPHEAGNTHLLAFFPHIRRRLTFSRFAQEACFACGRMSFFHADSATAPLWPTTPKRKKREKKCKMRQIDQKEHDHLKIRPFFLFPNASARGKKNNRRNIAAERKCVPHARRHSDTRRRKVRFRRDPAARARLGTWC